jgi:periplasmic divalent cation tolerance protein
LIAKYNGNLRDLDGFLVADWIRKYKPMTQAAQQVAIVLTTFGVGQAAAAARVLVEERLAACVNVLPAMTSVYRWEGAVQQEAEEQVVIKTTADRLARLESRLRELHPYDVPEFLVISADAGSEAYLKWVGLSTHDSSVEWAPGR